MLRGATVTLSSFLLSTSAGCLTGTNPSPDDPFYTCNNDGVCDASENQIGCGSDCFYLDEVEVRAAMCRVAVDRRRCDANENWTFAEECARTCGNGRLDKGESLATCPRDLPQSSACGDGLCAHEEDPLRCPRDCQLPLGEAAADGVCDDAENGTLCPQDCPARCGDGRCDIDEKDACPRDCAGTTCVCGDGTCGLGEDDTPCPNEDLASCPDDCKGAICGNNQVDLGEECDDGNVANSDACTSQCKHNVCGDGAHWPAEEACDDGNTVDTDACTNACELAVCGDGVVRDDAEPEACDDGNAVDTDACTNACTLAVCGDGVVRDDDQPEACDDGNADNTDACLDTCAPASCGDGFTHAGVEECDDGNAVDTDACSDECERPRTVFVTSATFSGDLGGLAGADAKCRQAATAGVLPEPSAFMAWIASAGGSPATRFAAATKPFRGKYVRVDGVTVAQDGWGDLTDGSLAAPISVDEMGEPRDTIGVWTGAGPSGKAANGLTCSEWTSGVFAFKGHSGTSDTVAAAWTSFQDLPCNIPLALYCVEQ